MENIEGYPEYDRGSSTVSDQDGSSPADCSTDSRSSESEIEFRIIPKKDILKALYCMWENTSNVCWLDASMALLSHNHSLRYETSLTGSSQLIKIIKYYNEAICYLNDESLGLPLDRLTNSKKILKAVQDSSLKYLQPLLKFKEGDHESAFCSFMNLISKDECVKKFFETTFTKSFHCEKCGWKKTLSLSKTIITLPKVATFQPSSPRADINCPVPTCKADNQKLFVAYETLPKCLLFHFEGGAGKGEFQHLDFTVNDRSYKLTGLMTLVKACDKKINHFVTWIREPNSDAWLECNDLNQKVLTFTPMPPNYIKLEEIYMIMFEAFDDLGNIQVKNTVVNSKEENEEKDYSIPFIDLSQDNEDVAHIAIEKAALKKEERSTEICEVSQMETLLIQQAEMLKNLDLKPKSDEVSEGSAEISSVANEGPLCVEALSQDSDYSGDEICVDSAENLPGVTVESDTTHAAEVISMNLMSENFLNDSMSLVQQDQDQTQLFLETQQTIHNFPISKKDTLITKGKTVSALASVAVGNNKLKNVGKRGRKKKQLIHNPSDNKLKMAPVSVVEQFTESKKTANVRRSKRKRLDALRHLRTDFIISLRC